MGGSYRPVPQSRPYVDVVTNPIEPKAGLDPVQEFPLRVSPSVFDCMVRVEHAQHGWAAPEHVHCSLIQASAMGEGIGREAGGDRVLTHGRERSQGTGKNKAVGVESEVRTFGPLLSLVTRMRLV